MINKKPQRFYQRSEELAAILRKLDKEWNADRGIFNRLGDCLKRTASVNGITLTSEMAKNIRKLRELRTNYYNKAIPLMKRQRTEVEKVMKNMMLVYRHAYSTDTRRRVRRDIIPNLRSVIDSRWVEGELENKDFHAIEIEELINDIVDFVSA